MENYEFVRNNEIEQTLEITQTEECKIELAKLLNSSKWQLKDGLFFAVKKGYDNVAFSKISVCPEDIKINQYGHFIFPHKEEVWTGFILRMPQFNDGYLTRDQIDRGERLAKAELRIWNKTLADWKIEHGYDDCYGKMHYDLPDHPNAKRLF